MGPPSNTIPSCSRTGPNRTWSHWLSTVADGRTLRQQQRELAEADFTQLIEQHSDSSVTRQALYARALCRQQAGQFEASLTDLDAFQQREPSRPEQSDALYVRGLDQVGLGQLPAAIATFESIVRDDPQYNGGDKVLYELAWSLKNDQQADRALAVFAQLAEERSESPLAAEAYYHVGEEDYRQGEYQAAAEAYENALRGGQQGGDLREKAQYKLGWSRYQLGDYPGALKAFQQQLKQQPDGNLAGDAHFLLGECHFKMQNHQLALKAFQQATARAFPVRRWNCSHACMPGRQRGRWGTGRRVCNG